MSKDEFQRQLLCAYLVQKKIEGSHEETCDLTGNVT